MKSMVRCTERFFSFISRVTASALVGLILNQTSVHGKYLLVEVFLHCALIVVFLNRQLSPCKKNGAFGFAECKRKKAS